MKIRIGIVEDQIKILENLKARFAFFEDIEIVMTAVNAEDCLSKLKKIRSSLLPQVLLVDIEMPGKSGIELTREIKKKYPDIDILIQTVFEDEDKIFESIYAGASGYLLKDDPIQQYVDAVHELTDGGAALSSGIASKVLSYIQSNEQTKANQVEEVRNEFSITEREMEILEGIVDDLTEHEIGERLFISHHTVRTHIKNIYKKLHVHSRASAVRFAVSKGLFKSR